MPKRVFLCVALGFGIAVCAGYAEVARGQTVIPWQLDGTPTSDFLARLKLIRHAVHTPVLEAPDDRSTPQTTGLDFRHVLRFSQRRALVEKLMDKSALDAAGLAAAVKSDTGPAAGWVLCAMLDHPRSRVRIAAARLLAAPSHYHGDAVAPVLAAIKRNNYPLKGVVDIGTQLAYRKALWTALEKITGIALVPVRPQPASPPSVVRPQTFGKIHQWLVDILCLWDQERSIKLEAEADGASCFLNLDTGLIGKTVEDIYGEANRIRWYKQIGLDVVCRRHKTKQGPRAVLEGIALKTAAFKPDDDSTARLSLGISRGNAVAILNAAKLSSRVLPDAFVFETDMRRVGVLRVTHADKDGIKLRYKLAVKDAASVRECLLKPPSSLEKPARTFRTTHRCKAFDRMLEKNGFVVTAKQFPQMFSAYIPDSWGSEGILPPFITTDSAWHTYHVLLEEGVKQLEQHQAVRLRMFSRRLMDRAAELRRKGQPGFDKVADYASLALAMQDESHAVTLTENQKQMLAALKEGTGDVRGPVGFTLSGAAFRACSFYRSSKQLADYFAARQWYAMVVFPLKDPAATSGGIPPWRYSP